MGLLHPIRDHRRKELAKAPFPAEWTRCIDRNVLCCRDLSPDERKRLEDLIKVFVAEKSFEGCGGLVVTDEIRVTVAAQACLLLLNLRHDYYGRLVSILVYPESFEYEREERGPVAGTVSIMSDAVSGLSSSTGAVVLSWPDAVRGARDPQDGVNVVFHEFAHQLDQMNDVMDGAPMMEGAVPSRNWAQVMGAEFARLREEVETGLPSLISAYGATQPAEFFAVVTELFFERPVELQHHHPALYGVFRQYYGQDPAARRGRDS